MKRFLSLLALGFMLLADLSAADRPNIIFILSDDVGLGNISCYGGAFKTPNIDALAKGGTRFEYCYANPVCGPSRATCLTGTGEFFDLKEAPFKEIAVAADTTDADAKAGRERLQAVLADLKSQDKITGDTPPRKKKNK